MSRRKQKTAPSLYFISLVPKGPLLEELWSVKRSVSEKYETQKALNSPPHITLHMPFKWSEDREEELFTSLEKVRNPAIAMNLDGFGAFPPRVLFIQVERNEIMQDLFNQLKRVMNSLIPGSDASHKGSGFTPHLTIAFRDLKKEMFNKAWDELKNLEFKAHQELNSFHLLKHNGKNWELYREFPLF